MNGQETGAERAGTGAPERGAAPAARERMVPAGTAATRRVRTVRPRRFRALRRVLGGATALMLLAGAGGGLFVWHSYERYAADLPTVEGLRHYQPRVMSRVYAGDSRLMAELATERRIFMPVGAIPDLVKQAFISAEDQKFWTHRGLDPAAIARAIWVDVQQFGQGRRPIGASTITQQVAKNMLLSNEVSIARKAKEAILALKIERSLSKERILELYLNEIFLGLQSYGVAAAAQAYFNKGLDDLSLAEAAFLAALPKAPNNYNPFRFPDAAKARRDWVIDRMLDDRAVTAEQAQAAKATPIQPAAFRRPETVAGGEWFAEEVRRQLIERFGADQVTGGGYAVRTSLDPALQAAADRALRQGLMQYDRARGGWRGPVNRLEAGPALRTGWSGQLAGLGQPPGMVAEWRLAVVLDAGGDEAKLGWLDRTGGQPVPRNGSLYLSDTGWARPLRHGTRGPVPRRMADVVQPGDVVMVEPAPAQGAGRAAARPDRVLLRQIPAVQGALVSLDPATGRVLAMSGGWSPETSQFNRATQAQRQPGSSFKPFVYLTALEAGYSPSQRVLDAPFVQDLGPAGQWRPTNYDQTFHGPIAMRMALEKSLNTVTIRLAERVGMDAVAQKAVAFHVVDGMPRVLAASLGAVESTVLRQAAAYAGLAMGGREVLPTMVDSVQDRDGKVIWRAPGLACQRCDDPARPPRITDGRRQIADPQSVFQLVTMMQGAVSRGTGTAAAQGLGRPVAGKTGTTQDFNDAWFVGFTPDLATAVWIGFDNNTSLGEKETGGVLAAPIFRDYMSAAMKGRPALAFRMPDGLRMATWSGNTTDAFKPGQEPGASQGTIGGDWGGSGDGLANSVSNRGSGLGVDSGMGGLY